MDPNRLDELLFIAALVGQLLLAYVLFRHRLYKTFPIFCSYIVYSSISDIAFWFFLRHAAPNRYAMAYFSDNACEFLLQIGILLEVGWNVLNPVRRSLPRSSLWVFFGLLAVAAFIFMPFVQNLTPAQSDRWVRYFFAATFVIAVLRILIFAVIAGFSQLLGIGWKNHVLQIATGLLVYSTVDLLVELLNRHIGTTNVRLYRTHEQMRIVVWCMALGYWSHFLSKVEGIRKEFSPKMSEFLLLISQVSKQQRTASDRLYRK
jgi:uncharacterized membrane protein